MRICAAALLFALTVSAQDPPPQVKLGTGSAEVLLDLVVRDKKGRPVKDLALHEIEIVDDGIPTPIKTLRFGNVSDDAAATAGATAPLDPLREVRLITFLFEPMNREAANPARRAAQEIIARASGPNVYFAVLLVRERLRVLQPYTADKTALKKALELAAGDAKGRTDAMSQQAEDVIRTLVQSADQLARLKAGDLSAIAPQTTPGAAAPNPAAMGAFADVQGARMMLNMMQASAQMSREGAARPTFRALRAAVDQQRPLPGRKTLVYFSEGLQVPAPLDYQFKAVIGAANAAGVSIYCIDATGLEVSERTRASAQLLREAAQAAVETVTMGADQPVKREQVLSLDTAEQSMKSNNFTALAELASSTGGFLIADTNDLSRSAQRVAEDVNAHYQVSYVPPIAEYDGRFRAVSVRIKRPNVKAQTRSGYFALPPGAGPGLSAFEVPLLKLLDTGELPAPFPFRTGFIRLDADAARVRGTLMLDVPLDKVRFHEDASAKTVQFRLALLAVFRDDARKIVAKVSRDVAVQYPREQAASAAGQTFPWRDSFELPPGRYTVETAVWDRTSDTVSTRRDAFTAAPPADLDMSDIVVVKRFEPVDPAAPDLLRYSTSHAVPALEDRLPLAGRAGAIPLFFRIQTSNAAAPVTLTIQARRDGIDVADNPLPLPPDQREPAFPYLASIPTESLTPGRYEFTIAATQGSERATRTLALQLDWAPGAEPPVAPATAAASESHSEPELRFTPFSAVEGALAPDPDTGASMLNVLAQRAADYVTSLPNFFCIQTTRRLTSSGDTGAWKQRDTWQEILSYVDGHENYQPLRAPGDENAAARKRGVSSRGELGGVLEAVLGAKAQAAIHWKSWAELNGERMHVFEYRVLAENSTYALTWSGNWRRRSYWRADPAYDGLIFVDPRTLHIRRITLKTGAVPPDFPIQESTHEIDYELQRIGESDYLMPVHAVVQTRIGKRDLVRNEIQFRDYRKWAAASSVTFDH